MMLSWVVCVVVCECQGHFVMFRLGKMMVSCSDGLMNNGVV